VRTQPASTTALVTEGVRIGSIIDPTVGQVAVLVGIFRIDPTFFLHRKESPFFDGEPVQAARRSGLRHRTLEFAVAYTQGKIYGMHFREHSEAFMINPV
jgi:hypothetical protein